MERLIAGWVNEPVLLTLRTAGMAGPVILEGTLTQVGDGGVVLLQSTRPIFIPVTSILHITLAENLQG